MEHFTTWFGGMYLNVHERFDHKKGILNTYLNNGEY